MAYHGALEGERHAQVYHRSMGDGMDRDCKEFSNQYMQDNIELDWQECDAMTIVVVPRDRLGGED